MGFLMSYVKKVRLSAVLVSCIVLTSCAQGPEIPLLNAGIPKDDGYACYEERRAYYVTARNARATETILKVAGVAFSTMFRNIGSSIPFFGGSSNQQIMEVVSGLQRGLAEDRTRIVAFRSDFDALTNCRTARAKQVNRDYRRGQIKKAEANQELMAMRSAQREDIQVARETNLEINERTDKFALSVRQSRTKAREQSTGGSDGQEAQQTAQEVEMAEESLQTNQQELRRSEKSVEVAEARTEGTFEEIARWLHRTLWTRFA